MGRAVAIQHPGADLVQEADQFPGHPAFVQFRQFIEDAGINQEDQGDGVGLGGVAAQPQDLGGNLVVGEKVDLHRGLVETPILAKSLQQSFKHGFANLWPMVWRLDLHPGSFPGLKAGCKPTPPATSLAASPKLP